MPVQTFCANHTCPNTSGNDHDVRLPRLWQIHGALLRGAHHGSTLSRLFGMLLLDPKAPGALLCRRLRFGIRGRGKGGEMVRDFPGSVPLSRGEGGMPLLCRPVPCRTVRARGPGPVRQASRSTWGPRAAATGLGGELSAEL